MRAERVREEVKGREKAAKSTINSARKFFLNSFKGLQMKEAQKKR